MVRTFAIVVIGMGYVFIKNLLKITLKQSQEESIIALK